MDHKQQIYEEGSGEAEIIRTLGLKRSNLTLLDAFRCCPYIVRVASEFIEDLREREAFLNQSRTAQTEIQTPLLYQANALADERARLIEVLRERQIVDRTIAILFAQNRQVEGFARGLRDVGIPVETRKGGLNFGNSIPKLLTIHSAKGLTFETVLMPRLVSLSFSGWSDGWTQRLLYVGMTRATKWLYLSTVVGEEIPAIASVRRLAGLKPAVVTVGHPSSGPVIKLPAGKQLDGDDLLDIL
jgi:superfamily I DNA/RNA helicase